MNGTAHGPNGYGVARRYREALQPLVRRPRAGGVRRDVGLVRSVYCVSLGTDADRLERRLATAAIETRRWWGHGAHAHRSTSAYPRAPVPVTEELSRTTLGIPMFRDFTPADVDRVVECIEAS